MATLNISAGQICVGDVFLDGDTVYDFEFFSYPNRQTVEIYVTDERGDYYSKEFEVDAMITVETDYLDREVEGSSENWEDALEATIFEDDEKGADNVIENVGDLLDY